MKQTRSLDDRAINKEDRLAVQEIPCKVAESSSEENPSAKDNEVNGAGKQVARMAVNKAQAMHIQLGLDKDDGTMVAVCLCWCLVWCFKIL